MMYKQLGMAALAGAAAYGASGSRGRRMYNPHRFQWRGGDIDVDFPVPSSHAEPSGPHPRAWAIEQLLDNLARRGEARGRLISSDYFRKSVGLVVYRPKGRLRGFSIGQTKRGNGYRGGIGPFASSEEAAMAIWQMKRSDVRGLGNRGSSARGRRAQSRFKVGDQVKFRRGTTTSWETSPGAPRFGWGPGPRQRRWPEKTGEIVGEQANPFASTPTWIIEWTDPLLPDGRGPLVRTHIPEGDVLGVVGGRSARGRRANIGAAKVVPGSVATDVDAKGRPQFHAKVKLTSIVAGVKKDKTYTARADGSDYDPANSWKLYWIIRPAPRQFGVRSGRKRIVEALRGIKWSARGSSARGRRNPANRNDIIIEHIAAKATRNAKIAARRGKPDQGYESGLGGLSQRGMGIQYPSAVTAKQRKEIIDTLRARGFTVRIHTQVSANQGRESFGGLCVFAPSSGGGRSARGRRNSSGVGVAESILRNTYITPRRGESPQAYNLRLLQTAENYVHEAGALSGYSKQELRDADHELERRIEEMKKRTGRAAKGRRAAPTTKQDEDLGPEDMALPWKQVSALYKRNHPKGPPYPHGGYPMNTKGRASAARAYAISSYNVRKLTKKDVEMIFRRTGRRYRSMPKFNGLVCPTTPKNAKRRKCRSRTSG